LGVTLLAGQGFGILSNPAKANKFQSTLTGSYKQCTAPNTTTLGLGLPACQPAVLTDVCVVTPGGGGKLQAKPVAGDLSIKAKLKGLGALCEGETLCVTASARISSTNCAAGPDCTVQDLTDFPLVGGSTPACCVVSGGKCKIKTTLNSALPIPAVSSGKNYSFDIRGCSLTRTTGTSPGQVARCGVVIP